jgi:hypothetical protein
MKWCQAFAKLTEWSAHHLLAGGDSLVNVVRAYKGDRNVHQVYRYSTERGSCKA